jgi:REP element-mobilizing transposase RayT
MDQNAKHNAHCVYAINYHLVWTLARRYRKKVLVEPIAILLTGTNCGFGLTLL